MSSDTTTFPRKRSTGRYQRLRTALLVAVGVLGISLMLSPLPPGPFTDDAFASATISASGGTCTQTVSNTSGVTVTRVTQSGTTFCVIRFGAVGTRTWTIPSNVTSADVLIVAGGGGGGGNSWAGGGGAGGVVYGASRSLSGTSVSIVVGGGGAGGQRVDGGGSAGSDGGNSSFGDVTARGGGGGAGYGWNNSYQANGRAGGSGGGSTSGAGARVLFGAITSQASAGFDDQGNPNFAVNTQWFPGSTPPWVEAGENPSALTIPGGGDPIPFEQLYNNDFSVQWNRIGGPNPNLDWPVDATFTVAGTTYTVRIQG